MKRLMMVAMVASLSMPLAAQDKAADVMKQAREALGGKKVTELKALTVEGTFVREMGNRQVQGTLSLTLQFPDHMYRSEDTELMGGMSLERTSVLNGASAWEDIQNRGGMGGGAQIMIRNGPPGQELNPQQVEEARLRRMRTEFNRYLLAFAGGGSLTPTYVAVAEAPEGKADVVEVKNEAGQAVRLFIDQTTHLPLMLQYQEVRPRFNMMGGPGGPGRPGGPGGAGMRAGPGGPPPDGAVPPPPPPPGAEGQPRQQGERPNPEEMRRRMESMPPPAPSNVSLYLGDYKKVDGVMLPHRLTQAIEGKTVEEWTIEKVKVNPTVKADLFDKK
jgi:hypothetical protein